MVALYDAATNMITFAYESTAGERVHTDPLPAESGLTATVIRTRRPLVTTTASEAQQAGAVIIGGPTTESWLGVPMMAGDELVGVVALESTVPNAFDDDDMRLVSTLAASAGIALANARLFDDSKRLLAETEQRAAELAVVNEIGEALAKQLDFQGIIEAVGVKVGEVFGSRDLSIAILNESASEISFPYWIENGVRDADVPPISLGEGVTSQVLTGRRPLRIATAVEAETLGVVWHGEIHNSYIGVPIPVGDRVIGVLSVSKIEASAFSGADEQLLSTIASSMGVALENARLFGETRRLLTETEQRAAELAVVNEIGEALARQLDFEGIVEAVGDKVGEVLRSRDLSIAILDEAGQTISFPYWLENGKRQPDIAPVPIGVGLTSHVLRTGAPLRLAFIRGSPSFRWTVGW